MKSSHRKLAAAAAGVGIAPLVAIIPAASAFAHGYVSAPMSRQAQCAKGIVQCGAIKYEPQSVEGRKGQRTCHGGNGGFAELNDDSKGWQATNVSGTVTFTWTFTARHSTTNYEYWVGGRKVADIPGNNKQPPATLSHQVNLGGVTGKQKVLAIWNIADTSNAFYACIDVNVQ